MRLLNATTLQFEFFHGPGDVAYAILSHTWQTDEVLFEDMRDLETASMRAGFAKIRSACDATTRYGLKYIWIDTCCIDKSSSAELSEAINSMFRWYREAEVCFAFLADFPNGGNVVEHLGSCRWFSRGWTLQELIAPKTLLFFDGLWSFIGDKARLGAHLEAITGISQEVLDGSSSHLTVPIAKRMSWASKRQTTRIEDAAYSLLGIFDVNLSMIYGEGSKAFIRLQEEILRRTTDLSIFAWQALTPTTSWRGILAQSPAEFSECTHVRLNEDQFHFRDEITVTNRGIKILAALNVVTLMENQQQIYVMNLDCYTPSGSTQNYRVGIYLERVVDTYVRSRPHEVSRLLYDLPCPRPELVYIVTATNHEISTPLAYSSHRYIELDLTLRLSRPSHEITDLKAVPEAYWEGTRHRFYIGGVGDFLGFVRVTLSSEERRILGVTSSAAPETETFLIVCELTEQRGVRADLYTQKSLERYTSWSPASLKNPFTNIDSYGPVGDPFSLRLLRARETGSHTALRMMSGGDGREKLVSKSASLGLRVRNQKYVVDMEIGAQSESRFSLLVKISLEGDKRPWLD